VQNLEERERESQPPPRERGKEGGKGERREERKRG
jgi:hypothetical protein